MDKAPDSPHTYRRKDSVFHDSSDDDDENNKRASDEERAALEALIDREKVDGSPGPVRKRKLKNIYFPILKTLNSNPFN